MSETSASQGLVVGPGGGVHTSWVDPERGAVAFRTVFSSDLTPSATITTGVAELEPGAVFRVHRHTAVETYYVLTGAGLVTLGTIEHPVTEGTSVFIPSRTWHGVSNTGDTVLRLHYVLAADSLAHVDYDFSPG